jgi:hypothetical protein
MGIQTTREEEKKMSQGFDVEIEMPKSDIDKLLKQYKKIKKYQKSSLFAIKTMDGTEDIISLLLKEAEENPL